MANVSNFGSAAVTQSYTDDYVYTDGIGLPTGRAMANGSRACLIQSVSAYASGRGGARAVSISFGPRTTSAFTVGAAGSAANTGWRDISDWLVQGGTTRVQLNFTGSTFFGRSSEGLSRDSYGTAFGQLGGGYQWAQSPNNPTMENASPTGRDGVIHVNFRGASDDGGSPITGYRLQWSRSSTFGSNVTSLDTASGVHDIDDLLAGDRYYFRVAAKNAVTAAAGTVGPWSNVISAVAPGPPSAPRNASATPVTSELDAVTIKWDAPSDDGGGITGYDIWNGSTATTPLLSTKGTGTQAVVRGLLKNRDYTFHVHARNAWVDRTNVDGPSSNNVPYTNWSSASDVRNVTATASATVAGRITVAWQPPADVGRGITKYSVFSSTGTRLADLGPAVTSYNVDNLTPGVYYAFYVLAYTAVSDTANKADNKSNTAGTTSLGDPPVPGAPQATPSVSVAGRLTLTWTQPAGYTGFNVYEVTSGTAVLLGTVTQPQMVLDFLTLSPHAFVVAARNTVTDQTTPPGEGPRTSPFYGTPGSTTSQATTPFTVPNNSNALYNGTYKINAMTPTSLSYLKTAPAMAQTFVPLGAGSLVDTTNAALSGVHPISAIPSSTQFSFNVTVPDVPANTSVAAVTATNQTNQSFITTDAAPATVTATNSGAFTISYANTGTDIATVDASGTITNKSNAVYNGTGLTILTLPASNQLTYAKTNANLAQTGATGTVTNTTNRDQYNRMQSVGVPATILTTPAFNTFTYAVSGANQTPVALTSNFGVAFRASTRATLNIKYRSGWAG